MDIPRWLLQKERNKGSQERSTNEIDKGDGVTLENRSNWGAS